MIQLGLFDEVVDSKVCNKCKIDKPFSDYHKGKANKDGLSYKCKSCTKEYDIANSEKNNLRAKEWVENNKERSKQNRRLYYKENIDKIKKYQKEYYKENIDKIKPRNLKYINCRIKKDPIYKLKQITRNIIWYAFKNKGYSKTTRTYKILGCDFYTLLNHLNNNKYGFVYGAGEYDVDHILPLAIAKTEADIFDLNYYKNLQLLPSEFNRHIKRDRVMTLEEIDTELKEWLKKPC